MLATFVLLAQTLTPSKIHLLVDGLDRTALVYLPTRKTSAKPPILIAFHGHGGSPERLEGRAKLEDLWPDAIVVYPYGLPMTLQNPAEHGPGWVVDAKEDNRDIRFFDALLKKVVGDYRGDPAHVFAFGFSNGAIFMYTLWNLRGRELAGIGSAEGCLLTAMNLSPPKPFFMTIGSDDNVVPVQYQRLALEQVKKTDRCQTAGTPYGERGLYFKGRQPVVYWPYQGGHEFPVDCLPTMIRFFSSLSK
ncbi:MAG TPA: hypothetical protein VMI31_02845 [Fimbriimonadaceae bacterium]|nr:hypothetical protein [Fimbriimonadaceae bacterium]